MRKVKQRDSSHVLFPLGEFITPKSVEIAKRNPKSAKRLKIAIAAQFGLPDYRHVNLEKALQYLRYLESPEAKLEKWLDEQVRVL